MKEDDIHIRFRDFASVNLLFAALERSFPLFLAGSCEKVVDESGKHDRERIFLTLKSFSTNFPHAAVDGKG